MKKNKQILTLTILILLSVNPSFSQTDTTELSVGKKKLIIIDKKTQKENAIYNLEKGKEYFQKQIAETEKTIEKYKKETEKLYIKLDSLKKTNKNISGKSYDKLSEDFRNEIIDSIKNNTDTEKNNKTKIIITVKDETELEKLIEEKINNLISKQEIEKTEAEIEKLKTLTELEQKKQLAFKNGIKDIENGIAEMKNGINSLNNELKPQNNKKISKRIDAGNINNSPFNAHWAGFEIGLLNFISAKKTIATPEELDFMLFIPEKTVSYGLNIFEYNIPLNKKNTAGIASGAGIEWNSISLKQNINLYEDEDGIIRAEYINPAEIKYEKNKLNAAYITVPVIIEIQIPLKKRKIYFGAGITGSIRGWSKQKQKYKINNQTYKNKTLNDFQLSSFRYGTTARIGYGDIGLFVNYNFVPLYKKNAGPEIYPLSFGIKIVDF